MGKSLLRMRHVRGSCSRRRRLLLEPLEHRLLLDVGAAGLADDRFDVRQNSGVQMFDVLANDTFMPDYPDERQITSVSYGSEGGRIEIADVTPGNNNGGSIRYAPPADFAGTETFVYYVDNQLSASVTVTVLPLLAADEYDFPPDGEAKVLKVLANDPFWPGYDGPREITAISSALLWGGLEIAAGGKSLTYTPPMDAYGKDAFVYIVDDLYPAEVQIDILNPLEPDNYPDIVQRSENNVLGVSANDNFWPGYPGDRTITHVIGLTNGATVTVAGGGQKLLYTPAPDFAGRDYFRYVVDGVYETSVSLQVHRPVRDDSFEVDTNTTGYPLMVIGNDVYHFWNGGTRITRDVIDRVTSVGKTEHGGTVDMMPGSQGIFYSAPAGFEGTDTFEYIADGKHPATVRVSVTRPVRDDSISSGVYEDTVGNVLNVMQNDFKGNGYEGPKIITSVSEASEGGIVTIADGDGALVYTPPAGFLGTDTFRYEVDGELLADVRVNVRPIATSDSYRFYPNPAQTSYTLHVLGNDHFGSNYPGPGRITAVGETRDGGLVTITADRRSLRFVPAEGGSDRFTYTVDGKYEASVSVSFDNFLRSDSFVVDQNSGEAELDPLQNDFRYSSSNDYVGPRLITSVGPAEQGGVVTIAADRKSLAYTPAPDFVGTDRFTYTVDRLMKQTISVQVVRRVRDDVYRVEPDSSDNALPVLVNDLFGADYTGAGRVTAVTDSAAGGEAAISDDGKSIEYTPPAGFTGEDTFTYTVDGALKAQVTVRIAASVEDVLARFDSLADFEQSLLDDALQRYDHLFGKETGPIVPMNLRNDWFGGPEVTGAGGDLKSHSETNVQVAGVDEADIIETDGSFLYIVTDSELIIATAWPAKKMEIASRVTIEGEPIGEYLHSAAGSEGRWDRLTVVSQTREDFWVDPPEPWQGQPGFVDWWWPWPQNFETWVTVFDVSDRQSPAIVEKTKLDGTYVESRRIDDSVFVVLRDDDVDGWLPEPERIEVGDTFFYETREQYIERVTAEMDSFLPHYTSYGADDELIGTGLLHASGDVFKPLSEDAGRLVTVVSLNASDNQPGIVASTAVFTTGASQVYGSLDNLYVFDREYDWEDGTVTEILKFDWNAETAGVDFVARGRVPGTMLNQFSADEHDGHLRIATTISNSNSGNWSRRSENVLFVLRDDAGVLEPVGSMKNLALEETIRSVRFMGDRAFVTTFRNVDPLFALDLSDPANPRSRGHLTMPGFNSYMQLIDKDHLLTVGRNTPVAGTGPTQVSLFDVSDLGQPHLIDQYTFERFSTSEAETDHHAFGWFAEHDVLAMPSARVYWQRVDEDGDGYSETRRQVREDELMLFNVDVTATRPSGDGIELLGELLHDSPVRRSAFIENVLYSVAENSAQAVSIADPTVRFAEITFDGGPPLETPGGEQPVQIIDDRDEGFQTKGYWSSQADQGYAGGMHFKQTGNGDDVASWSFWVEPGYYRVAATWSEYTNRASNAPFTVLDGSTPLDTVRINQESAPDDFVEGQTAWENLGTFLITGNRLVVTLSGDADEYVVADAIRTESVPMIAGRGVFYNNSALDDPDLGRTDDDAIDPDKTALLPGGTATFANYTSCSRGINGVFVDIAGLTYDATPTADDFEFRVGNDDAPGGWTVVAAAAEPTITLRRGDGADGSDRVSIVFPDYAICNTWLQVTVLPTPHCPLPTADVFYFGNAVAEAGNSTTDARVNTTDLLLARNNPRDFLTAADVTFPYDFDRDGQVNATDVLLARNNQTNFLNALSLIDLSSPAQQPQESALPDLAWLYDYDEATGSQLPAKKDNSVEEAVDLLMGTYVE